MKQFFGKRSRSALFVVLVASFILHLAVLVIFGTIKLVTEFAREEKTFEAELIEQPPQIEPEFTVNLEQRNRSSEPPRPLPIVVNNPQAVNVPAIDIDLDVAVSSVYGRGRGGGFGTGMRDGGIRDMDMSISTVEFFGIKSKGEKVVFVVDASKHALVDAKGGIPAYRLVKEELDRLVGKLKGTTLFNVLFYDGAQVYAYQPKLVPGIDANKSGLKPWMADIHKNSYTKLANNVSVDETIEPLKTQSRYFWRGVQAAVEMNADTVFLLVTQSPGVPRFRSEEERLAVWKEKGYGPAEQAAYAEAVKRARELLKEENEARAKAGKPPRVVVSTKGLVRESGYKGMYPPGSEYFEHEEKMVFMKNAIRNAQPDAKQRPEINVVYFKAKGEEKENLEAQLEDFAKSNRGKFEIVEGMEAIQRLTGQNPK